MPAGSVLSDRAQAAQTMTELRRELSDLASAPVSEAVRSAWATAGTRRIDEVERGLELSYELPGRIAYLQREIVIAEVEYAERMAQLAKLTNRLGYRLLDAAAQRIFATRLAARIVARRAREHGVLDRHESAVTPDKSPAPASSTQRASPDPASANDVHPRMDPEAPRALRGAVQLREWVEEVQLDLSDAGDEPLGCDDAHRRLDALIALLDQARSDSRHVAQLEQQLASTRRATLAVQAQAAAVSARLASRLLEKSGRLVRGVSRAKPKRAQASDAGEAQPPDLQPPFVFDRALAGWPEVPEAWHVGGSGGEAVVGLVDAPSGDDVVLDSKALLVAGWALCGDAPISKVEVFINGQSCGPARLGYVRRDVYNQYQRPHAVLAGYDLICPPATLHGMDVATVDVFAETGSGRRELIGSRRVWLAQGVKRAQAERARRRPKPRTPAHSDPEGPFKLLVVTHHLGYGGGQLWLQDLLQLAGAGRDYQCTVIAPAAGPLMAALNEIGVEVHINGDVPLDDLAGYDDRMDELVDWAESQGFSAVLCNTFITFPGVELAGRLGIPSVWAIHESWAPSVFWSALFPAGALHRGVRRRADTALAKCQAAVFEADATRQLYSDCLASGAGLVVPYGVQTRSILAYCEGVDRMAARRRLGLDEDRRLLLVMGSIEPRKSQTLLAQAFKEVAGEHPNADLIFVGGADELIVGTLQGYLADVGLSDRVTVIPVVADAYPWYRSADALICASDVESLPRSVLEAMAFGLPVLATPVFGLAELLTDEVTGLLFPARDLSAAVAALHRLLTMSPAQLSAIARAGQQLVLRDYDATGYSAELIWLLQRLAKQPTSSAAEVQASPDNPRRQGRAAFEPSNGFDSR